MMQPRMNAKGTDEIENNLATEHAEQHGQMR
jgi:hypothetical protein